MQVNGWTLIAHPLFAEQLEKLATSVEKARKKDPNGYKSFSDTKLLVAVYEIVLKRIPDDPTSQRYRMGATLGDHYKHWFRDKFGGGRFRLFFRYDGKSKVIAYAWLNDETCLRTYGAKNDAYAVFAKMLNAGNPPDGWNDLRRQCIGLTAIEEIAKIIR
jgi:toxin YhaV